MAAKILVVDDDESLRELLRMHLAAAGYEVSTAPDAIAAGYQVLKNPPDLILSDISMPHMDGYEAARRLRAEPWGKKVVLIALTGWGRQGDIDAARNAGFDGHLLKPVGAEALIDLISRLRDAQR